LTRFVGKLTMSSVWPSSTTEGAGHERAPLKLLAIVCCRIPLFLVVFGALIGGRDVAGPGLGPAPRIARAAGRLVAALSSTFSRVRCFNSSSNTGTGAAFPGAGAACPGWSRRNLHQLPRLNRQQILAWTDSHQKWKGAWPTAQSRPVANAPGETWRALDWALRLGSPRSAAAVRRSTAPYQPE
jgi:hypothetical protein